MKWVVQVVVAMLAGVVSLSLVACGPVEGTTRVTDKQVRVFARNYDAAVTAPSGFRRSAPKLADLTTLVDYKTLTGSVADASLPATGRAEFSEWSASHSDAEVARAVLSIGDPQAFGRLPKVVQSVALMTQALIQPIQTVGETPTGRKLDLALGGMESTATLTVLPFGDRVRFRLSTTRAKGLPSSYSVTGVFEGTSSGGIRLIGFERQSVLRLIESMKRAGPHPPKTVVGTPPPQ
jgi:hypothetical protein